MIKNKIVIFAFLLFIASTANAQDFAQDEINAYNALISKQWNKSIDLYTKMINQYPQNAPYYEARGYAYAANCQQTKDLSYCQKAVSDCDKAIALGSRTAYIYYTRALVHVKLKHLDAGMADLNQALNYTYGDTNLKATIYYMRGKLKIIYSDKYNANSGRLDIERAKQLSPSIVSNFEAQFKF